MRLLMYIITGMLLVTYAWGWTLDVHYGSMNTQSYTHQYMVEVKDQARFIIEGAGRVVAFSKKPIPRPGEFRIQ